MVYNLPEIYHKYGTKHTIIVVQRNMTIVHLIDLINLKSQAPNIFLGSIYIYKDPQIISLQKINV